MKAKKIFLAMLTVVLTASVFALAGCNAVDNGYACTSVKVIDISLTEEEYAFCVNKDNATLLTQVNDILADIMTDGTLDAILDKYFNGEEGQLEIESAVLDTEKDQLIVATNAAFAPFEFKSGNKFTGIDMEVAKIIADELGKELVISDMEFDSVIIAVQNGSADIGMAGMTVTEARLESVNFSTKYYNASQMLIVPSDDTTFDACTTAAEIEAKIVELGKISIGVQRGTTGSYYVGGDADWGFDGFANVTMREYDNGGLAARAMKNGQVKYVVIDEMPAKLIAAAING
jgi:polar amino acid transport system substrate-binding protein